MSTRQPRVRVRAHVPQTRFPVKDGLSKDEKLKGVVNDGAESVTEMLKIKPSLRRCIWRINALLEKDSEPRFFDRGVAGGELMTLFLRAPQASDLYQKPAHGGPGFKPVRGKTL